MKAVFSEGYVTFHRDKSDPRIYGTRFAKGEHALMHRLAKWLNVRGFDLIKKRAWRDNHLIGDAYQPYLRCRKPRKDVPHIYIWSGFYALHGANEDWNKGSVTLLVETDVFERGQDTMAMIADVCGRNPGDMQMVT